MMRTVFVFAAALGLAGCAGEVPDSSQQGVGFGDYDTYRQQRESQLAGEATVRLPDHPIADPNATPEAGAGDTQVAAAQPVVTTNNPGISDEQSFDAVTARESIQSDRERLEAQRENYVVIKPEALPERRGDTGPNIVDYALRTTNGVGDAIYSRSGRVSPETLARNCSQYASPDRAQQAFLDAGGPQRDRKKLDPDGDGFACSWDPRPFRLARQ